MNTRPRLRLGLCWLLLLCMAGAAQARQGPPQPLLWSVETGDHRVWLLGSIHVMRADDYPLAPVVERAFADAEHVVFEVDPGEALSAATAPQMLAAAQAGPGESPAQLLGPRDYARLQAVAAGQGVAPALLAGFRPWFVNLSLALAAASRSGLDNQLGLDVVLMRRALAAGKATSGLERAADQIEAIAGAPLDEQLVALRRVIEEPSLLQDDVRRLHALWRAGDVDGLLASVEAELGEQPETLERINADRNRKWLPRIEALARAGEGDVLIVVGSLHLLGAHGVVEGLRGRGWTLRRVEAVPTLATP
ncbi:TraB/GumN family protein [Coralloluteibacterium stylophorae]|uniref:TraB/GumN family protein n=1 Tax=Coralloluteibacterium stylophorae TaxID=1776034 RepID=A0A8J7VTI0_9GAMM|nr:TraB/GumN family protein [Coralloluteibacterium stylophorae]MBS7458722.1 TraB/GumN family protein [Coralloluteibacterium stylophorae]